ncbi:ADP-ribosylglycohydrolase family protein [Methylobacterium iners]|uniref:protein-tyrosine-phosphatase n=1 Tax=Methylobacterium iners TaxID=418707 RepID=A0ABQ4RX38_9HYPH|nr:ADP-ribosylglycohydrolase family protein [Methylobacterium iners]GJD95405.1 hypothetical protein OCOJLMKI_2617 [Methylobacterium iners]
MSGDEYHVFQTVFGSHSRVRQDRTSETHPLKIASVGTVDGGGRIGLCFCPGKRQADAASGSWSRDLATDIKAIQAFGAVVLVTLIEDHEIEALHVRELGAVCQKHGIHWLHLPIHDVSVPDAVFEARWTTVGEGLRSRLRNGFNVVVHCKGGLGRAGSIAAKLLVELGSNPSDAIDAVRSIRPGAIETEEQEAYVRDQTPVRERQPSTTLNAIRDRALGAMVGLAVGDAVGTTLEFRERDTYEPLTDMVGGGPFGLKTGEWTDDTSMSRCLADSLLAHDGLNERNLLERFCRWFRNGENSVTGTCFDIGNVTRTALERFESTGDIYAGPTDPRTAGNGSLMRLSPVAIRFWNDPERLRDAARRQSYTTHGAREAVDACEAFGTILAKAIQGKALTDVLRGFYGAFGDQVQAILDGSWRGKARDQVQSSGYVIHSLEAALWCVGSSGSFEGAVLKGANLGDDADTTGAIVGQLAGAFYGLSGIPDRWLNRVAWRDRIEDRAQQLFDASL